VSLAAVTWLPSIVGPEYQHVSCHRLVDVWHRWDSGFFTHIALHGYGWQVGRLDGDATFMPLYPLLIGLPFRLLGQATREQVTIFGTLLSNISLLGSLFLFDALLVMDSTDRRARRLTI